MADIPDARFERLENRQIGVHGIVTEQRRMPAQARHASAKPVHTSTHAAAETSPAIV